MASQSEQDQIERTKRLQAVEQLTGFLMEQAQQAAAYFKELVRQGFTRSEALQLTLTQQQERFHTFYTYVPPRPEGSP